MKWINIKENIPKTDEYVLVYDKNLELVYEAKLLSSRFFYSSRVGYSNDIDKDCSITHWMPLPNPPESNSNKTCEHK